MQKKAMNQSSKQILKIKKRVKSDNFCYRKVGGAITSWREIDKSPISQYWENYCFDRVPRIISYFWSPIIFWSTVTLHILQLIPKLKYITIQTKHFISNSN